MAGQGNRGLSWEQTLGAQHAEYARLGLASIGKIPHPLKMLEPPHARTATERARFGGGGAVCLCRMEPKQHVDYEGVGPGGKALRLEAKSVGTERIALDAVQDHQAKSLRACDALGGFAAVLVLTPAGLFLVPWLNWASPKGMKSLSSAELRAAGACFGDERSAAAILAGASARADWLSAAKDRRWL